MGNAPLVYFQLLGGIAITAPNRPPSEVPPNRTTLLLAYLLLDPTRQHAREALLELLWPDEDPAESRPKLRQALFALRRLLKQATGEELLVATRATIQLAAGRITTDVSEFRQALADAGASSDWKGRIEALLRADAIYRGPLLPGFYEEFILLERQQLAEAHGALLLKLARAYEEAAEWDRAIETARRLVAKEPLLEEAHCVLMRAYAASGQPAAAMRQYAELERLLKEELDEKPSAAVRQLRDTIRQSPAVVDLPPLKGPKPVPRQSSYREPEAAAAALPPITVPEPPPARGRFAPGPARSRHLRGRAQPLVAAAALALLVLLVVLIRYSGTWRRGARKPQTNPARLSRVAPEAQRLWAWRYTPQGGDRDSEPSSIVTDTAGCIYIAGFLKTAEHDVDYLVLKLDPNGRQIWEARYNGLADDVDRARGITLGSDGSVYVTGDSLTGGGNGATRLSGLDLVTIKLDPHDGHRIWVRPYDGPAQGEDRARQIRIDRADNVYVAGVSWSRDARSGPASEFVILKYDAAGDLKWAHRQPHGAGPLTDRIDMELAPDGDLCVTLEARGSAAPDAELDILTVRYRPDGSVRWLRRWGGGDHADATPAGIAVDSEGAVYVTGCAHAPGDRHLRDRSDILTIKYDKSGRELWVRRFDGPAHTQDEGRSINVDGIGSVYVAGSVGRDRGQADAERGAPQVRPARHPALGAHGGADGSRGREPEEMPGPQPPGRRLSHADVDC
ncbi:MAG TPA: BTAD domain-containing putative transcriptional regulator [Chthonomonadaceae bacterium]|nr:BTAD domain-containing putative transcriptional regulator [Chthonomonadaceae bacterium]